MSNYAKEVIIIEFEKSKLIELKEKFDSIIKTEEKDNIEFWYARDLQIQLGYKRWENFIETIKKAMQSCENAGIEVDNHFREVTKMVQIGSGARRNLQDYMLTRYACYLIAQNGDSKKEEIAFAQTYFAVQTRKQEIIEDRIKLMTLTIAAKNLATEMTNYNVTEKDMYGEESITDEHVDNNLSVRNMLNKRGIKPENLKPAEDLKKLERRVKSESKKIADSNKLPKNEAN